MTRGRAVVAREAHNLEVAGSSPAPATNSPMNHTAQKIIERARKRRIKIAVAESVTGGRIASALTSVPGSSEVFICGIVAYHVDAKIHSLGVSPGEIEKTEGYSAQAVEQMAENIRMRNTADVSVATTGCAGPEFEPGFENGRVIFAVSCKNNKTQIFDEQFDGDREEVQQKATAFALTELLKAMV